MTLEGRGAVITGGGRGIGAATARALAVAGARVVVAARSRDQIEAVAESLRADGHAAWAVACDVTDQGRIRELKDAAVAKLGQVDILVNNAGAAWSAPLKAISLADWERIMAVNATSVFLCTQTFLPEMLERRDGRIVNVASIAGKMGAPYIAAYCAAKHAVVGFTRAVAAEVAASGITVNAVCPGYVDTPMTDQSVSRIIEKTGAGEEGIRKRLRQASPQNRLMEPEEIAFLVTTLCARDAGGINGQAIVLDGGGVQS